ncbi:MAG: four helix bundle protein [bacterium]|nr:four helix bundle protein [bacterium]
MARIRGDLGERTMRFALSVIELVDALPNCTKGWAIGRQLMRSGTSVGANVREADHALTDADFAHKCSIARKEAAETQYWLELSKRAELLSVASLDAALDEADQLTRILGTLVRKTQEHTHGAR